jgi:hypothetical protein
VHDECVIKMSLFTLLDLDSHASSGQIPYSLIRDSLQVGLLLPFFFYPFLEG